MDEWGIDVVAGVSGKGLGATPGVGILGVSDRALELARLKGSRSFYFDWAEMSASLDRDPPENAWTPPISVVLGLSAALRMLPAGGIDEIAATKTGLGRRLRRGLLDLDFDLYAHADDWTSARYLPPLLAAFPPNGVAANALVQWLWQNRGIRIARGQGKLRDRVIRIAYFGAIAESEIEIALGALADAIAALRARRRASR
jgi:alanine-glyoxylate transaminase/serine-glyoxylate transaminase/serine-pyruvate transaminase